MNLQALSNHVEPGHAKENGTISNHTVGKQIEEPSNIRLILENVETQESVIVGVTGKQTGFQKLLNL
ncbi:hypothetical protein [Latilactobacillus curvatus]|uniref:hypothetical protein n=1 Tax=Latilactobacillus curvatus TaxID=28038 RepID=UPI0020C74C76|nr:hypothetical protein [Latilactobacillus curvatus]MCP8859485.1 hypothetical protein [Latilactobacillus curvatus]